MLNFSIYGTDKTTKIRIAEFINNKININNNSAVIFIKKLIILFKNYVNQYNHRLGLNYIESFVRIRNFMSYFSLNNIKKLPILLNQKMVHSDQLEIFNNFLKNPTYTIKATAYYYFREGVIK
jgi:hypothetical protein